MNVRQFHIQRIAFFLVDEDIVYIPSGNSHLDYAREHGMHLMAYPRGYYFDGRLLVYQDILGNSFAYTEDAEKAVLKHLAKLRSYIPLGPGVKVECGAVKMRPGDVWPSVKTIGFVGDL